MSDEFPGEVYLARWIVIVYPLAGLAELLAGIGRRRSPAPAIALVDGAALGADRRIHKLQSSLVGIVNALVDEAIATLLTGKISLTHGSAFTCGWTCASGPRKPQSALDDDLRP